MVQDETNSTLRVPLVAAVGTTGLAAVLGLAKQWADERAGWSFPSWGETTTEMGWMSGVVALTVAGLVVYLHRAPHPSDAALAMPLPHTGHRRARVRSMTTPLCIALPAVAAVLVVLVQLGDEQAFATDGRSIGLPLLLVTLAVRWPLAVLAQQAFFFGWLQPHLGARGMQLAAVLYAAYHLQVATLVALLALGFLFAWLRARTGTIHAGMAAHYIVNVFLFAAGMR
jgi:hypothetical protein